jgi:type III pantothenate kinase
VGLCGPQGVFRHSNFPTSKWFNAQAEKALRGLLRQHRPEAVTFCSVVPRATRQVRKATKRLWAIAALELTSQTVRGLGIDYPKPKTIGADRLANALAASHHYGAPVVVVDFGTAVTFDVVNRRGDYTGGIIAPGLAAMTEYLHDKTALLPRIKIREPRGVIGKSTEEAMLVGAVHGYRGLIRQLVQELKKKLGARRLPVIATGGYGTLIAKRLPEITSVDPLLTLEGLRLYWESVR